jgi:hypothetical protein
MKAEISYSAVGFFTSLFKEMELRWLTFSFWLIISTEQFGPLCKQLIK